MNLNSTLFLLLLTHISAANLAYGKAIAPGFTKSVKYSSGETYPNEPINFTFEFPHCPLSSILPTVKEYQSEVSLPDAYTSKMTKVRVVHLHVFDPGGEQKCPVKKTSNQLTHKVAQDPKKMTHYYVIMDSHMAIKAVSHSKK